MRTSNKILLGGLIATLIIVLGIHIALYAKIKNGDLVELKEERPERIMDRNDFQNINHVYIKGLIECTIIPSNAVQVETYARVKDQYVLRVSGDTLFVEAKINDKELIHGRRMYQPVAVMLPNIQSISATWSTILLRGSNDSTKSVSQSLELFSAELRLSAPEQPSHYIAWDSLTIGGHQGSQVYFMEVGSINKAAVKLSEQSSLNDGTGTIGQFSLQMDSTSTANLHHANLQKLKENP